MSSQFECSHRNPSPILANTMSASLPTVRRIQQPRRSPRNTSHLLSVIFACCLCWISFVPQSHAQDREREHEPLPLHINDAVIARIDLQRANVPELLRASLDEAESSETAMDHYEQRWQEMAEATGEQPLYIVAGMPGATRDRRQPFPVRTLISESPGVEVEVFSKAITPNSPAVSHGGYWMITSHPPLSELEATPVDAAYHERLAKIQDLYADYPVQICILPPEHLRRAFSELMTELPKEFGGGSVETLVDGMEWASIGVQLETLRIEATIQSASPEAAKAFAEQLPVWLKAFVNLSAADETPELVQELVEPLLDALQVEVRADRVVVTIDDSAAKRLMATLDESFERLLLTFERADKMQKLKQLGLALHNYYSAYKVFPPFSPKEGSEPGNLSWRVHILPFLEESELYDKFALDEPWDSPQNIELLDEIPAIYAAGSEFWLVPSKLEPGHTMLQTPVGEGTIFGGDEPITFGKITDGTSNTLWLVEVAAEQALPWTAPRDYEFDPDDPAAGLNITIDGRFVAGMTDGSVHSLSGEIDAETLLHLFQMNDGHPVDWGRFR
jgi:hypothetical protein